MKPMRLLDNVVAVAARQAETGGVGVEQALVAAQQALEGVLVASLRGLDEGGVVPRADTALPRPCRLRRVRVFIKRG
jgi:hypothetical protein